MTSPGSRLGIGMGLRYSGSSILSRSACRGSMRDEPLASTLSSGRLAVAKLRRLSRKRLNSCRRNPTGAPLSAVSDWRGA